ncbi:hypothetical protein B296_00054264 [Ensete ventricosum]|uniref:Uncharacterized protein n=1 Tax=Ensete ventricosum TaxID=4639 RepID=A0A426WXJ8_ENSVE|nr:hypothetical protein B296_00054264 [Ensete ventricosum]
MPKVTSGKVPPTRPTAREVCASPAREAPKASLKRSVVSPPEHAEEAVRRQKKVKVLTRRHKSRPGEGESRSRSKEAVAEAEERASELREELEKTKRERGEELLRRETLEKELARKMDDELLQAVKDLEST